MSDKGRAEEVESFEIFRNVRTHTRNGAIRAFKRNDVFRKENAQKKKIKNSIVAYHDMISFHHKDREFLNQEVLRDLTEKYIELRCPDAVVFAKPHLHNKNLHVHILISGSNHNSYELTRLSDAKWRKVRREIEKYQKEYYPELENSLVYDELGKKKRKGKAKRKDNERMMRERGGKILDKDLMKNAVLDFFKVADSPDNFYRLVSEHGIETYSRIIKGKEQTYGVLCNGRKMRFSTIGIKKAHFQELQNRKIEKERLAKEHAENDTILAKYSRYRINRPKEQDKGRDRDIER